MATYFVKLHWLFHLSVSSPEDKGEAPKQPQDTIYISFQFTAVHPVCVQYLNVSGMATIPLF